MDLNFETVIKVYDEEVARLVKENILLKAQIKQVELDKAKEEE